MKPHELLSEAVETTKRVVGALAALVLAGAVAGPAFYGLSQHEGGGAQMLDKGLSDGAEEGF